MVTNRIAEHRKSKGLTLAELAKLLGTNQQQVWRLEQGKRKLSVDWITRIAAALDVHEAEILAASAPRANTVTADAFLAAEDRILNMDGEDPVSIDLPSKMDNLCALEVRTDDLWPVYGAGDMVLFEPAKGVDDSTCINRECVVQTRTGSRYLKRLMRGAKRGSYRLTSPRRPDIEDVDVAWASPILWIKRKK